MPQALNYKVEPKENVYFAICLVISLLIYTGIILGLVAAFEFDQQPYVVMFGFYLLLGLIIAHLLRGVLVGVIRGNAVKLGPHQFGDIHEIVMRQSQALGLTNVPDIYLLQAGGTLNAFATRFMGSDYIVLFSDVMEQAYEKNLETVEFITAHELGHVKRNHILKRLIVLPAMLVPFLGNAYSRACEYTCDSIGASLSEEGARSGMLVLAAGTKLFSKVNVDQFVLQAQSESGFWLWFSEKVSTHPHLIKRLARFPALSSAPRSSAAQAQSWDLPKKEDTTAAEKTEEVKPEEVKPADDASRFMPG